LRRRIVVEKQEAEYSVIRHLAHNVKPGLQIVRSPLLALQELLDRRGLLAAELSRRLDGSVETVGDALNNAIASLGQINAIIDNTRQLVTREIDNEALREIELKELLERDVLPLHAGKFKITVAGGPVWVSLHRESFVEAINNLLRNAEVHGFPEPDAADEVCFTLRQTRKMVVIDYSNNGRPFPANLSTDDFLSFGRKGADSPGEGLGGAWIGKVIEAHDGDFEIIRNGQPLHFRITLPKRGN
jgi:nitrogen fixation/metabolism regulation signal transduction histidine kinase